MTKCVDDNEAERFFGDRSNGNSAMLCLYVYVFDSLKYTRVCTVHLINT